MKYLKYNALIFLLLLTPLYRGVDYFIFQSSTVTGIVGFHLHWGNWPYFFGANIGGGLGSVTFLILLVVGNLCLKSTTPEAPKH